MSVVTHAVRDTNRSSRIKRSVIRGLEYFALLLAWQCVDIINELVEKVRKLQKMQEKPCSPSFPVI